MNPVTIYWDTYYNMFIKWNECNILWNIVRQLIWNRKGRTQIWSKLNSRHFAAVISSIDLNYAWRCREMWRISTQIRQPDNNINEALSQAFTIYQFNIWLPHSQKGKMHRLATKPNTSLPTIELICKCIVCLSEPGTDGQDGVSSS